MYINKEFLPPLKGVGFLTTYKLNINIIQKMRNPSLKPGTPVEVKTRGRTYAGILMERSGLAEDNFVVIKLENGYNIGIRKEKIDSITPIKKKIKKEEIKPGEHRIDPKKPDISILATGGTIASRVDYLTGGVHSAFSAEELISAVPELEEIANLSGRQIFNKFSENMQPKDWAKIAEETVKEITRKATGVVITHGTDTMHYTAAALAFMLKTPVPVVLTGAQRSSDRGSSDAAFNLINAARVAARGCFGEVCVVMHAEPSDTHCFIHPATKVRKLHSSRRDAFRSVNSKPLGKVSEKGIDLFQSTNKVSKLELDTKIEENVSLLKYYPGMKSKIIDNLVRENYRGIVLEGTGLGHTSGALFDSINNAINSGVAVAMTSQTIFGTVNMNVYSTGRKLIDLGVIPCRDMLSETAYVKLMFVLGHTKKRKTVREMMLTNYAREISKRRETEDQNLT